MDHSYQRKLRRNRVLLMRELPDVGTLLSTMQLRQHFSEYERRQIIFHRSMPAERAAKFLDALECKSSDVYLKFLAALRELRPDLAIRFDGAEREASSSSTASSPASNGSSSPPFISSECVGNGLDERYRPGEFVQPVQEQGRREERLPVMNGGKDEAGPYGLNGSGVGPTHHLSHLSYEGREFLSQHLNGNPPDRNVFHSFCDALGVENRLVRVSARSRNPTAYLMQEYSARPDATFDRLEQALTQIGKRDVFDGLWTGLENDKFDAEYR